MKRSQIIFSVIVALIMCLWIVVQEVNSAKAQESIEALAQQNEALQQQIHETQQTAEERIEELTAQVRQLWQDMRAIQSRGSDAPRQKLTYLGEYTVTGFCPCEKCCGKWAKNRPGGKVYGAGGIELIPNVSVAAPLPIGTRLMINGKEYIVHDRTADWIVEKYNSKVIDIYKPTHAEAWNVGNGKHDVWMIEEDAA